MQGLLSFDKAPPFGAPLRFFLTAPIFAVLAAAVLVFFPEEILASRWTPAALIATHLITIGFLLQVMLGALIQVLPVVAGANIPQPLAVAKGVHVFLNLGLLLLVLGFSGWGGAAAFLGAVVCLGGAVVGFLAVAAWALWPVPSTSPTILGIKLAMLGLFGTLLLGGTLASGLALGWQISWVKITDLHAGWGLVAWIGGLVASLAYVVVPMFQLTPGYPARMSWWLPMTLFGGCGLWLLAVVTEYEWAIRLGNGIVALAGGVLAGATLRLQAKRRRAKWDATSRGWQFGMACVLAAAAMQLLGVLWPDLTDLDGWPIGFGALLGVGGIMSLIIGMLYKIIPFLSWLHLQEVGENRVPAPAMTKMLPEIQMMRQMKWHFASVGLLLGTVCLPVPFVSLIGLVFAVSNVMLGINLWKMLASYRRFAGEIRAKLQAMGQP